MFFIQFPFLAEWLWSNKKFEYYAKGIRNCLKRDAREKFPIEEYREAWLQPRAFTSMLNWYRAAFRNFRYVNKTPITVPTLLIWGKKDRFLDFRMAKPSIDLCNNGKLELVEGGGHFVQHDAPLEVTKFIKNFIST